MRACERDRSKGGHRDREGRNERRKRNRDRDGVGGRNIYKQRVN